MKKKILTIGEQIEVNKALLIAVKKGSYVDAHTALRNGADVNCRDIDKETPLWFAVANNSSDLCELILRHKPSVDLADKNGVTPLMNAIRNGRLKIAEQLHRDGANVNAVDCSGLSALFLAVHNGGTETRFYEMNFLVENGANLFNTNDLGQTALDAALRRDYSQTAAYLFYHMIRQLPEHEGFLLVEEYGEQISPQHFNNILTYGFHKEENIFIRAAFALDASNVDLFDRPHSPIATYLHTYSKSSIQDWKNVSKTVLYISQYWKDREKLSEYSPLVKKTHVHAYREMSAIASSAKQIEGQENKLKAKL